MAGFLSIFVIGAIITLRMMTARADQSGASGTQSESIGQPSTEVTSRCDIFSTS